MKSYSGPNVGAELGTRRASPTAIRKKYTAFACGLPNANGSESLPRGATVYCGFNAIHAGDNVRYDVPVVILARQTCLRAHLSITLRLQMFVVCLSMQSREALQCVWIDALVS